jgi:hypothetical protein
VGIVPGKSHIQAHIPASIGVKRGAQVYIVDIIRGVLRHDAVPPPPSVTSGSSTTSSSSSVTGNSPTANTDTKAEDSSSSSSSTTNAESGSSSGDDGEEEDDPTKGISLGSVRGNSYQASIPRAAIPQVKSVCLDVIQPQHTLHTCM